MKTATEQIDSAFPEVIKPKQLRIHYYSFSIFPNIFIVVCSKHCSLCYNATECYECTQGYFLTPEGECQSEYIANFIQIQSL